MKSVRFVFKALAFIFLCLPYVTADHWAVIVVGSRGYWIYRHQSDACHAYHVVRDHGIPERNIILMMYDDVAHDPNNPLPGTLYNRPTITSSTVQIIEPKNVYDGCHVEYTGDTVTPENFIHVLLGNKTATNGKRVLETTKLDRVFINFVDHGANGYIVFPRTRKLTAHQLHCTLLQMYTNNRYKELVLYMEACHAGSMFTNPFKNHNIFVTTAAN
uniref:Vacuolarprocessing enzyme putative n=1 Tax=Albugo laibachii Nc14 TaxID=890382 RepID=F0WVL2_9STRA|nr:vacuolarprocessing enzyme putative [Albugo laibachii Nc14]|eukprot:CCA25454.1 vacuolarprocessing enzyme putative [Albugo laibachii Nc14]